MTRGNGFLPGGNVTPSYRREIDDLKREIRQLKLMIANLQDVDHQPLEQMYSWPGAHSVGNIQGGDWRAPSDLTIVSLTGICASSTPWYAELYVANAMLHMLTVPAYSVQKVEQVRIPVRAGQTVYPYFTGVTGSDLTYAIGYKRGFGSQYRGA